LFDKLGELKTGEKTTGPDFFADAQIAAWCQEFQKNTDDHRPEALMEWIQGKANEISNEKMNNSFYSQFSASLQSILNTQGFPEAGGNTKMTFGKLSQGEFSANPHYWEESSKTISLSRSEAEKALQSLNETFGQFKKDLSAASGGLAATKTATEGLGAAQDKTLNAIGYSEAQAKAAESLPDKFIEALFKIYMPGQEAYLMALSMMLAFSNAGSGMCNSVLNMITGWANSANSYGFSNWYNSMTGKVTQSQVQNAMNSEINQINGDVAAAKNAVTAAQNEIKKINQQVTDGQITPSQGKALTDKLNNNILQFTGPDGAISHLNTLLDQLKNHTTVNKDGTLSPADAVKTIQNEEKMVINGDPASDPPGSGGLSNIYTSISNDLLSYESQSQQQQITLQMKMTQIQQEWTVVSTALQLLNQMYMTVAQSINK
jgi:outer membrane murein-binding lipoprotein Lpp